MAANIPAPDLAPDLSGLQQRALALETHAEARTQAYQRATWIRFVGVFFPIPFIVVLLRLEMATWTYYVWGALILVGGAVLYVIDTAASTRVDEAVEAAATASRPSTMRRSARPCCGPWRRVSARLSLPRSRMPGQPFISSSPRR